MGFFKDRQLLKSVLVLTSGTAIAQAINFLFSPILTRLYTPEQMGDLGVYMLFVGLLAIVVTMRYELAIPIFRSDDHAQILYSTILRIALVLLLAIALLAFLAYVFSGFEVFTIQIIALSGVGAIFLVWINLGSNWSVRKGAFKTISMSKVVGATTNSLSKLGAGLMEWGSLGLIAGAMIGQFFSSLFFASQFRKLKLQKFDIPLLRKGRVLMRQNREFPNVSLPHALVDAARDLIIALSISFFFSKTIFGSYNHAFIVLRIPLILIGASLGQVLFKYCAEKYRKDEEITDYLKKIILRLTLFSILPFTVLFLYGEEIFGFVFGENWILAGRYSEIMSFWLGVNLIASPLSTIPIIIGRQKEFFILGLISTIGQLIGFTLIPFCFGQAEETFINILWGVSIFQCLLLGVIIILTFRYSNGRFRIVKSNDTVTD